ncbi:nucleotidyltransferase family protein [Desulfobulbus alkaliphilus]|uniref:nucleotidyltransferase family protein n=1 Tax=Desulfobulbus alkaliphilus TaxID=869814 RepID=UPI001962E6FC|nr:nucleotidyltransferase family protein [Desulfobulbus alkaliphilus]MBM9537670.1 nucleotidyltransferase family protein [Desulfobulbus alkaliphilus]
MGNLRSEISNTQTAVHRLRQELPRLRREYSVVSLGLFGSYVRGEQHEGSDLDVLVEFSDVPGILKFLDLERDLSAILGVPVDLVQKEALKPAIGKRIMKEVLTI